MTDYELTREVKEVTLERSGADPVGIADNACLASCPVGWKPSEPRRISASGEKPAAVDEFTP